MYWLSKATGLFLSQYLAHKFTLKKLLLTSLSLSTFTLSISISTQIPLIIWLSIALLGFFNSVIYAGLISFGSLQVKKASPKLVTFILTAGTTGTMLYPVISGYINNSWGNYGTVCLAEVFFLICILSFIMAYIKSKDKEYHSLSEQKDIKKVYQG